MYKCTVRDGGLTSVHIQRVDAPEMYKCAVRDGGLVATTHIQRVDAFEIHKCAVRDDGLVAPTHIQRVDASEIHKCSIGDLITIRHIQTLEPLKLFHSGYTPLILLSLLLESKLTKSPRDFLFS